MNDTELPEGSDQQRAVNDSEPRQGQPGRSTVNKNEPTTRRGGPGRRKRGGRRGGDGQIVLICWRDIPAQVNAGSGESRAQRILPRRFQRAIDRAAMVAGKTQASQYVGEWRRVLLPGDPADPEAAAVAAAARLEDEFPRSRLDAFVAAGGWDPDRGQGADQQTDRDTDPNGDPDPHLEAAT